MSEENPHLDIQVISADKLEPIKIIQKDYEGIDSDLYPVSFNRNLVEGGNYEVRLGFKKPAPNIFRPIIKYIYGRENHPK